MTEKDFQSQVEKIAKQCGWLCYHTYDSRRSEPGFPDLVLVKERVIFAELKTDSGKLSPAQMIWEQKLIAAGAEYRLWRPGDIQNIVKILTR